MKEHSRMISFIGHSKTAKGITLKEVRMMSMLEGRRTLHYGLGSGLCVVFCVLVSLTVTWYVHCVRIYQAVEVYSVYLTLKWDAYTLLCFKETEVPEFR